MILMNCFKFVYSVCNMYGMVLHWQSLRSKAAPLVDEVEVMIMNWGCIKPHGMQKQRTKGRCANEIIQLESAPPHTHLRHLSFELVEMVAPDRFCGSASAVT